MAKRILIYTNHFYPENFKVNEIATLLVEEGHEVLVITGIPNYPEGKFYDGYGLFKKRKEEYEKVKVVRLPLIPRGSGSKVRLILNYLTYFISCTLYTLYLGFKKKYNFVFVHHTSPILIAIPPVFYKWIKNPKMILWDLDMWPDTLKAIGVIKSARILNGIEKVVSWIYRKYDHILVGSKSFELKAKERTEPEKIIYFPNWAEEVFQKQLLITPDSQSAFPVGFNVMYAGNIGEAQDFENVFKAIVTLKDKDINWLFVGDGRQKNWFQSKISNAGLAAKVFFYGSHNVKYMPYFFNEASALFFSLKNEEIFAKTVPAKLQAYMASGKPIIAMISGEGAEIIDKAKCGFSVNSGDFKSLAKKVLWLSQLDELKRIKLGENGKAYYQAVFSLKKRKKELLQIIDDE